jgi:serine/threonine protein kinase
MTLPVLAKKVKKIASMQFLNLRMLLNGRGFSKFKKGYRLKGEMGSGGFGIVYRAVRICDDLPVAVKFIERRHVREWGKLNDERVPLEICMLARCSKVDGVIRLIDWYSMPEGFLIVMERPSPCIDLFDFIRSQRALDEDLARFLFRQVVQTVSDCAGRKVLHRDIKDENVVIDLISGTTKLIDFGAATLLKKTRYHDFQGTRLYCPPEWFLHSLYLGREAAIWSLGILLYNMLNGKLPYRSEKDICTVHLLGPLPYYASLSSEAKALIEKCLSFDPFNRPQLDDVLNDPWLTKTTPDWLTLTASTNVTTIEQSQNDEKEEDMAAEAAETAKCSREESGLVSDEGHLPSSAHEVQGVQANNKHETSVAPKVVNNVRRNAKTSLMGPSQPNYANLPTERPAKTKSGLLRPLRQVQRHVGGSFDSGTSSFAFTVSRSHESLQSPLASPFLQFHPYMFPDVNQCPSAEPCGSPDK